MSDYTYLKVVLEAATQQGAIIGASAALLKALASLQAGTWRFMFVFTDFIAAMIVGFWVWEVSMNAEISTFAAIFPTFFFAMNAFFIVALVQNPKNFAALIKRIFAINLEVSEQTDVKEVKKDEKDG